MDSPDQLLLAVYVEDQSEEAFRQLVENHLSMVYHTALRRTAPHFKKMLVNKSLLSWQRKHRACICVLD